MPHYTPLEASGHALGAVSCDAAVPFGVLGLGSRRVRLTSPGDVALYLARGLRPRMMLLSTASP